MLGTRVWYCPKPLNRKVLSSKSGWTNDHANRQLYSTADDLLPVCPFGEWLYGYLCEDQLETYTFENERITGITDRHL